MPPSTIAVRLLIGGWADEGASWRIPVASLSAAQDGLIASQRLALDILMMSQRIGDTDIAGGDQDVLHAHPRRGVGESLLGV